MSLTVSEMQKHFRFSSLFYLPDTYFKDTDSLLEEDEDFKTCLMSVGSDQPKFCLGLFGGDMIVPVSLSDHTSVRIQLSTLSSCRFGPWTNLVKTFGSSTPTNYQNYGHAVRSSQNTFSPVGLNSSARETQERGAKNRERQTDTESKLFRDGKFR